MSKGDHLNSSHVIVLVIGKLRVERHRSDYHATGTDFGSSMFLLAFIGHDNILDGQVIVVTDRNDI